MAEKTPVRVVFNSDNVATGMAEFQTGETVAVSHGGTGLTSIGSSLQVLRVNAAGNSLEFGTLEDLGDIGSIGSTLTAPSNADFTITTAGTGNIILNDLSIIDNTLTTNRSNDDLKINASGSGTVVLENLKVGTSGATVTTILDEDAMGSDSATSLATQQSIKAYVDSQDANIASDTLTLTNKTFDVEGTGNSISNIDVADLKSGVLDTDLSGVSGSDDTLASAKAIKSYVDSQLTGSDLDFSTDDSTALSISLSTESLQFSGGSGISTRGSANTVTIDIDTGTVVTKTDTQTLTNKTLTSAILNTGVSGTAVLDEDNFASNSATQIATQQSIKAYVDTQDANIASDTLTLTNKTFDVEGTGNSISNIDVADFKAAAITTEAEGIGSNDNDTSLPTSAAVKDYVDTQITAEDLDFSADDSTVLSIDLDSEVLHFAGGNGISTSVSNNTVTHAIDTGTVVTLADSQTLTNKVLTSPTIDTGVSGTAILDEDNMSSNSATKLATQQSIKAYVDAEDANIASDTLTFTNKTFDVEGTGNSISNIDVADLKSGVLDTDLSSVAGTDTTLASAKAIKSYVDSQVTAQDLDLAGDSGTGAVDLDSQSLTIAGGTGLASVASSQTVTLNIDSTVATLTGSQTLTNKVLTSPTIEGNATIGAVITNEIVSNGSNADINLTPAGTGTVVITTDATVGDDLSLVSDAAVLNFGSDSEIKLTHVHDTGLLLTDSGGTPTLQLHDANESIASDGSKIIITSGGTTFNLPTADGTSGQALVTDGAGTLSFDTVSSGAVSDDTLATVRNNKNLNASSRTIDSFNTTFTDSAWYMLVQNDLVNEVVSTQCFAVSNNDTASFISGSRGIESAGGSNMPTLTTDVSNTMVRLRAAGSSAECKTSFYKIPLSSANTADATRGNTVTTSNTDVDSASESIDTFAHATFRGAKYFISIDNDSKTEVDTIEALVVHDGSNAFITSYGGARTGNNHLLTLTADIVSDNVVLSAAGLEPNLNVTIHKILIKDNMTAESATNQKAFASVTVSSSATAIDTFDLDDANGAVYYIVSKNATEGSFAISEVFAAASPGVASVAEGPQVSTKSTPLIEFSAAFDTSTENSFELFASSTAGGSTTVSGYRISVLAG